MDKKAKFYWARIGEGNYEPVAVCGKKGERMAYTIGCPDPFSVDGPDSAILLADEWGDQPESPMTAPLTPKQEESALRRERRARALMGSHGYAGFGRK